MLTVSRSVDRVFQIMEIFSAKRRPLSATEIRLALQMPHSSAVSVLSRLVALGYLGQNAETKRFFPSLRLHRLCESLPEAVIGGGPLANLVDLIQSKTDETTSLSRLEGVFTTPIYVRSATHAQAERVIPGLTGGLAIHSVVGRTLLSTLSDGELQRFLDRANYWAKRVRVPNACDPQELQRNIDFVREHGYLCGHGWLLQGVGAVCCPLPSHRDGVQLVIAVAGTSERIERRSRQIIATVLREVERFAQTVKASPVSPSEEALPPRVSAGRLSARTSAAV